MYCASQILSFLRVAPQMEEGVPVSLMKISEMGIFYINSKSFANSLKKSDSVNCFKRCDECETQTNY